ncbi:MAG: DNA-binding domain-containing protein [Bacteriovoracaceae bacterium]|nr:DNA-binding domain-containing protein [Bacteriovoracaceae bacterium]
MSQWFAQFAQSIKGSDPSEDLIGAGSANASQAMAHYRFQHQAKIRDAIEESYPSLISRLGKKEWNGVWREFWKTNSHSPRSLDYISEVFLNYLDQTALSSQLKALAKFELRLESFPWTHEACVLKPIAELSDHSKLDLGPYEIVEFSCNVIDFYQDSDVPELKTHHIIFWLKDDGVNFRIMEQWERKVLALLPQGVETALRDLDVSEMALSEFFQWLGQSSLIQEVHNS